MQLALDEKACNFYNANHGDSRPCVTYKNKAELKIKLIIAILRPKNSRFIVIILYN